MVFNWRWIFRWALRILRMLLSVEMRDREWMIRQLHLLAASGHQFAPLYTDSNYYVMDRRSWNRVLWVWRHLHLPYTTDFRDCEDYASTLKALMGYLLEINGIAEVWDRGETSAHAFNMMVFPDGFWEFCEPQTGQWMARGPIQNGIIKV